MAKLPELNGALRRAGKNTVVHVVEAHTIDRPGIVTAHLEVESMVDSVLLRWPLNVVIERRRNLAIVAVVGDLLTNDESHDLVGIVEFADLVLLHVVLQSDVLACES